MSLIKEQSEQPTYINSPLKDFNSTNAKEQTGQIVEDKNYFTSDNAVFNGCSSLTEQQINSHSAIRQIIQKSKRKTVHHNVNKIPISTQLYGKPKSDIKQQFDFNSIPPINPDYSSTCSKKVQEINTRLSDTKNLSDRLSEIADRNRDKCRRSRPASADFTSNANKRVSVSGLVSYDFNSVKARRSLGNIPESPQQTMLRNKVRSTHQKNSCSYDRQNKIIRRKPNQSSVHRSNIEKAAVCDFHIPTQKFLQLLQRQSEKDEMIYGERMEKLNCIKQYMEKQKTDYDESKFIVNAIISTQNKVKERKRIAKQYILDDDKQLDNRKTILKKKRIMMKHLYFADV